MRFSTVFIRRLSQGKSAEQCILAKNGFLETGERFPQGKLAYLAMERRL